MWVDSICNLWLYTHISASLSAFMCVPRIRRRCFLNFIFLLHTTDPHPPEPEEIHALLTWVSPAFFFKQYLKLLLIRQHKISYLNCKKKQKMWEQMNVKHDLSAPYAKYGMCVSGKFGDNSVAEIPITLCSETYTHC